MSKKILIIDSNALIHRAYHALPPFMTKQGILVNAVYGYITTLQSAIDQIQPDYIVATFDLPGETFRHKEFVDYKANRKKAPDDLYSQIPIVRRFLKVCEIPIYQAEGFEADDVIGTISKKLDSNNGLEKFIVTGDRDTLQLVNKNTKVFTLGRGINDAVIFDEEKVQEKLKIRPDQVIDYKALRGDPSDNIPGIPGIGDKTATNLIQEFETLENLYKNLDKISSKSTRVKLEKEKEKAFMSRNLAEIKQDVDINFDLENSKRKNFCNNNFREFLINLEFKSLLKRFFNHENQVNNFDFKIEDYTIVGKKEVWEEVREKIENSGEVAISYKIKEGKIEVVGLVLSSKEKDKFQKYFLVNSLTEELQGILVDEKIKKIFFDAKDFSKFFINKKNIKGNVFLNNFFDVKIASYLINPGFGNDFEKNIFQEFGEELRHKTTQKGQSSFLVDNKTEEEKELIEQAIWIYKLYKEYNEKIRVVSEEQEKNKQGKLINLLKELENPLVKILAKMEFWGIKADKKVFEEVSELINKEIAVLEKEIFKLSNQEFNINSPSQLAEVLYKKLKIPTIDIKKGKTGFSTNAEQLQKIKKEHPVIEKIERYREIFKLKTTYSDSLSKLIDEDERIRTTFNQTITATGRLSSSDPNLQNIPLKGTLAKKIRTAFVAEEGKKLLAIDYSQIDLRVAAHVSGDPKMIEVFENDRDIHSSTAAWVNGISLEEVTKEQRREAKSLNFGVLYGMGVYGFMQDSGVSRKRAEFFIEQYMKNFNVLAQYLEKTKEYARENGYVETEMGRRRYVGGINSSNFQIRSAAERIAINLPIQGLAADIMKKAMIDVDDQILKKFDQEEIKMILQVHDELIFEVKESMVDEMATKIKDVMEKTYKLKVPLKTESSFGDNWGKL